ncbi:reverse transcriptase domain-containing protein [Tanacetum coccineum]|uniref:Reverse transcriptase domain-containing protein n=1 Tax=Tanacetum coccineum TaxID=301880 RepID=A0ABQ5DMS7_9ASTR
MRTRSQSREPRPPPPEGPPVVIEPLRIEYPFQEDPTVEPMADTRTMAQLLQAPTEGYEDAILIPEIVANNFELKHGLINLVQNKQFFGHDKEDPHAHIRYFNKITSTMRVPNVPIATIKLMLFPFSIEGAARIWLEKEPPRSIQTWDDLVSKFINQFFPPSKTTNLRNEITRFQQRFDESFYEAWDRFNDLLRASGGNFLTNDLWNVYKSSSARYCFRALLFRQEEPSSAPAQLLHLSKQVELSCVTCWWCPFSTKMSSTHWQVLSDNISDGNNLTKRGFESHLTKTEVEILISPISVRINFIDPSVEKHAKPRSKPANPKWANFDECFQNLLLTNTASTSGYGALHCTEDVQPPVVQIQSRNPVLEPIVAPVVAPVPNPKPTVSLPYPSRRDNEKSLWEKLSLPDLTPTCMTLKLRTLRSISKPLGIAIDQSPLSWCISLFQPTLWYVDFEPDPESLYSREVLLKYGRALIVVHRWNSTPDYDQIVLLLSPIPNPFGGMPGEIASVGSPPQIDFKSFDTKGAENLAADSSVQIGKPYETVNDPKEINEVFLLRT